MTAERGRRRPVHVIESGPAAGVIATAALARAIGAPNAISIDMGGTTAKASIIEGYELKRTGSSRSAARSRRGAGSTTAAVSCCACRPSTSRRSARAAAASYGSTAPGALHVGPRSAGAVPGPVCYGQGGNEATLTDANVVLGYLHPSACRAGSPSTQRPPAARSSEQVRPPPRARRRRCARRLPGRAAPAWRARSAPSPSSAGATRAISRWWRSAATARSSPPRWPARFGIGTVLVPPAPGVFSAVGLLEAEIEHHLVPTFLRPLSAEPAELAAAVPGSSGRQRRCCATRGTGRGEDRRPSISSTRASRSS